MGTDHLHFHPKIMSTGYLWKWFNLRAWKGLDAALLEKVASFLPSFLPVLGRPRGTLQAVSSHTDLSGDSVHWLTTKLTFFP